MADVIKGPWGKKPQGPDKRTVEKSPTDKDFVGHVNQMHAYLSNLKDSAGNPGATEENIEQRQKGLESNTIGDLTKMIWNSDWRDWAAHPSFYYAAARTLHKKIKELREKGEDVPKID